jgi:beta-lactam-binding protein with PASTA domain
MRRLTATITLGILAVALLAGCGSTSSTPNGSTASTPNVVGLSLDKAHQAFVALGFKEFDDKDAFENRIAVVLSNWAVLGQGPAAGTKIGTDTKITLTIGKIGEDRTTARLPEGSPVLAKIRAEAAAKKADAERKAAADRAAAATAVAEQAAADKAAADVAAADKAAADQAAADQAAADKAAAAPAPGPAPAPPASAYYANCDAVRAAGAAPIHRGDPGYSSKLDRDGDGIGCE